MPVHTADALVLRTYKLGEADRIVVFLTSDRGKKRGVARAAQRPRSRFVGALEPLTRGRIAYFEREQRDLVRLNYMEALRSPLPVRDPEALGYVEYFAELIDEWVQEGDPSEKLFRLGVAVADALAAGVPGGRLARYFEYWLLRLQGVYPSTVACHRCGADLSERGAVIAPDGRVFVCRQCEPAVQDPGLSPEALAFLRAAQTVSPDRLATVPLSPRAAGELEAAHEHLIAAHLEKTLKSVRVVRELRLGSGQ